MSEKPEQSVFIELSDSQGRREKVDLASLVDSARSRAPRFGPLDPPLGSSKEELRRFRDRLSALLPSRAEYNDVGVLVVSTEIQHQPLLLAVLEFFRRTLPFDPSHIDNAPFVQALTAHQRAVKSSPEVVLAKVGLSLELWASQCIAAFELVLQQRTTNEPIVDLLTRLAVKHRGIGHSGVVHLAGVLIVEHDGTERDLSVIPDELQKVWRWPTVNLPNADEPSELVDVQLPHVDMSKGPTSVKFPDRFGRELFLACGCELPDGVPRRGSMPSRDPIAELIEFAISGDDLPVERSDQLQDTRSNDLKKTRSILKARRNFILKESGWL